ncbi:MAG: hypothetical protein SGPRY_011757, partial [Prymnesium sp.]
MEMLRQRKMQWRQMAVQSSGFTEAVQEKLCSHELNKLVTSLSRKTRDPSTEWIETPPHHGSRRVMMKERRQHLVDSLQAGAARPHMDANERVSRRVDQDVQALLSAPPGRSRAELLASRREERATQNEGMATAHGLDDVTLYSNQGEPFWKMGKQRDQEGGEEGNQSLEELRMRRK